MDREQRERMIRLLFEEECSCVVRNGDMIRLFRERGVKDLYGVLCNEPELLRGAFVADKVVGKGAAALMAAGGVTELFADVISRPACELLTRSGVLVEYTLLVPNISNRAGTGVCPVEQLCASAETAQECLPLITKFMKGL